MVTKISHACIHWANLMKHQARLDGSRREEHRHLADHEQHNKHDQRHCDMRLFLWSTVVAHCNLYQYTLKTKSGKIYKFTYNNFLAIPYRLCIQRCILTNARSGQSMHHTDQQNITDDQEDDGAD